MENIELIGLRTPVYDDIRAHLISYIEINKLNFYLVECNDLQSILEKGYESIPLIQIQDKQIYFNEINPENSLQEVIKIMTSEKGNAHSCKNCGNCRCPSDKAKVK